VYGTLRPGAVERSPSHGLNGLNGLNGLSVASVLRFARSGRLGGAPKEFLRVRKFLGQLGQLQNPSN